MINVGGHEILTKLSLPIHEDGNHSIHAFFNFLGQHFEVANVEV